MTSDYTFQKVPAKTTSSEGLAWDTVETSLPTRFELCVKAFPDRPAVVDDTGPWSYDRLNRAANRIAHTLLASRGPQSEPVAILFEQGAHFLANLLGILKAGKFYVPLDPLFPQTRNTYILDDSGAKIFLTNHKNLSQANNLANEKIQILVVEACDSTSNDLNPGLTINPEGLALLIYTSGSTGLPKGVIHNQRTLVHNSVRQHDLMHFMPLDRFSMVYSSSVMGTVRDYTNALLNGACLFPFNIRTEGISQLVNFLEENQISIFHTIPSVFRRLGGIPELHRYLSHLRFIILGGETLLRSDFEIFRNNFPDTCCLFTGLGMTETGTVRQNILTVKTQVDEPIVPLGKPLRDIEILLLDDAGQPVREGEVGEITVRSPYIALEYWNKPDETKAVFSTSLGHTDARDFHTGDLGEILPDGSLIHRGRKDYQIKIRGFRIELQEIEAAILETGLTKEAVVVGHDIRPGDKRLVAYIIPVKKNISMDGELRLRLKERLPDHMIPVIFIELETFPLTPNGKVDRRSLPAPDFSLLSAGSDVPGDQVEAALMELWKELFAIDKVGLDDNFFDLGGDSLVASAMFIEIDRRFGHFYPLSILIENNTIRKLAIVMRDPTKGITRSLVGIKSKGTRPPLFLIPGGYGDVLYLRVLAKYLHPEQPLYGIQASGQNGHKQYLSNMEEIAAQYLVEITEIQPHGPYFLSGHSFGGYVAIEMARLLLKRGEQVALVALFDTYPPGSRKQASLKNRVLIHIGNLQGLDYARKKEYLRDRFDQLFMRLLRFPHLSDIGYKFISSSKKAVVTSRLARFNYDPEPFPGDITLFLASEHPWYMTWDPMENWPDYIRGKLDIIPVSGEHATLLFEPYVKGVAIILEQQIAKVLTNP